MSVEVGAFVGDGNYVGDGGTSLQILWEMWPWEEMRVHCPGRYRVRKGLGIDQDPKQVLAVVRAKHPDPNNNFFRTLVLKPSATRKDAVFVARFLDGGGGLITYCKCDPQGKETYVHTLNTDTNLRRKLVAMQVSSDDIIELMK
eukprot:m.175405 g.175405  ORF g.175405 m.175405 type:complete len:144 (+) comp15424_c0_seq1:170-601(+)